MTDLHDAPPQVRDLAAALAEPKPMRRGSLSVRYLRCNKPGCQCSKGSQGRHGPYYSAVRVVDGKTKSRHVPAVQAETLRKQIEAGQEFRKQIEEYWRVCEQWADAELAGSEEIMQEASKKKGSKRRSQEKLLPRSKRS